MLRKLLIISCLFNATLSFAQKSVPNAVPPFGKADPNLNEYQVMGADMPQFRIVTIPKYQTIPPKNKKDSTQKPTIVQLPTKQITNKDVQYDANLFLMMFNPLCGHCEDMTELLERNIKLFNKTKVVMMAAPPTRPYMDMFENGYKTDQYPTLMVGTDSMGVIDKLFLYKDLPQINVYDKNRKLIKTFNGDTPIDSLKLYIQ